MPITIEVKELRRGGRAVFNSRYISIPLWANRTKEYFIYYVIHEITHFICMGKYRGHGEEFKMIEQEICKRYNIAIQYSKAYPKCLLRQDTGQVLCGKYGYSI
jgi:predicted SprT family Zn-dependent metalloprotease